MNLWLDLLGVEVATKERSRDVKRASDRAYYNRNRERVIKRNKAWADRNREKINAGDRRRYWEKKNATLCNIDSTNKKETAHEGMA